MEYSKGLPDSNLTNWLLDNFEEGDGSVSVLQLIDLWPNKEHSKMQITKAVKRVFPSVKSIQRSQGPAFFTISSALKIQQRNRQRIYTGLRFRHDPDSALIPIVILSLKEISVLALESGLSVLCLVENSVQIGQKLTICGRSIFKQLEICVDGKISVQMADKTINLQDFYLSDFMELTSTAVKNLLYVFQSIKACAGFLIDGDFSRKSLILDEWQEDGKPYTSYRSSNCTWAVPYTAMTSTCKKCQGLKKHLKSEKKEQAELEEEMLNLHKEEDDIMTEICNMYLPKELTNNLDNTAEECETNNETDPAERWSEDVQTPASAKRKRGKGYTGNKSFECWDCDESFNSKKGLQSHMRKHITVPPKRQTFFTCPICQIKIAGTRAHHRHMQEHALRHIGRNPFRCETCGADFEIRADLRQHMKTHPDTRSKKPKPDHKCEICDKVYCSRYLLVRHMRLHTGERPYVCHICGACFRSPATLCSHRYTHSDVKRFNCSQCDKKFRTRQCLQVHEVVHTKQQPYKCHLCERAFGRKDNLNAHIKRHMKPKNNLPGVTKQQDKAFKCDSCDQIFALELSRDLHKSIAHASDESDTEDSETPTNMSSIDNETFDNQPPDLDIPGGCDTPTNMSNIDNGTVDKQPSDLDVPVGCDTPTNMSNIDSETVDNQPSELEIPVGDLETLGHFIQPHSISDYLT